MVTYVTECSTGHFPKLEFPIVGRIIDPRDVHTLIPKICECVTLLGKRDFADVIKVKDLEMERLPLVI